MSFISYAQNGEDVLLWRALGHIPRGFYIDAGASDPVEQSVTKAFYDAGWSGMNIEPVPEVFQRLVRARPRDINLALAAGAGDGVVTLFDIPLVEGWASPDPEVAQAHRDQGYGVDEITVPMRPLATLCDEHGVGAIHFLKIDVEGYEEQVLLGMDFARWRPWVVLVEATVPNSRVASYGEWEALLTGANYQFAYFDGLNRYYVAQEHSELAAVLSVQANVFDDFVPHHVAHAWAAQEAAQAAASERRAAEQRARDAERRRGRAERLALLALKQQRHALRQARAASRRRAHAEQLAAQASWQRDEAERAAAQLARQLQWQALAARQRHARAMRLTAREQQRRLHAQRRSEARCAALAGQVEQARSLAADAERRAAQARRSGEQQAAHLHELQQWAAGMEQRLLSLYASHSWRMTNPLRKLGALVQRHSAAACKAGARNAARTLALRLSGNGQVRRLWIPILRRFPGPAARLSALLRAVKQPARAQGAGMHDDVPAAAAPSAMPDEVRALPLRARRVLADLQRARQRTREP